MWLTFVALAVASAAPIVQLVLMELPAIHLIAKLSEVTAPQLVVVPPTFTEQLPEVDPELYVVRYIGTHSGFGPSLPQLPFDLRHTLTRVTSSHHYQANIKPQITEKYPDYSLSRLIEANSYDEHWRLRPVLMEWDAAYGVYMVRSTLYFENVVSFDVVHVFDDSGHRRDDLDLVVLVENKYRVVRFPSVVTV